jgi:uncharacterized membrane protein YphA (DoxX/SURF4 family)
LFSGFPTGSAGVALLLLRTALGLATIFQGTLCLPGANGTFGAWSVSAAAILAGALLVLGFLTPIVAVLIGLGAIGIGFEFLPSCTPALFDSRLSIALGGAILAAIAVLGPGSLSVDARMFGRREIIIPRLEQ